MENNKFKIIHLTICGAIAAVIFITVITIAADLYLPLKEWLKNIFSHHWIGKGILSIVIFIVAVFIGWFLPITANEDKLNKVLKLLSFSIISGIVLIFLFFIYEAVWK